VKKQEKGSASGVAKVLSAALPAEKDGLHPRNRHRGRYDFTALVASSPELGAFVQVNKFQDESIDFANPAAVKALNRALLRQVYGIDYWDIPPGYLCPPIPGRADYLHYLADLLTEGNGGTIPRGPAVRALDIGMGANCIYPILGHQEYGWQFVGSDIDPVALRAAEQIVAANPALAGAIECRLQPSQTAIFQGIIRPGEAFDVSLCNPPFHASAADAAAGTRRKLTNLGTGRGTNPVLNFGGQRTELWCVGGEEGFARRMVQESAQRPTLCRWFTTLISKKDTLPGVYHALKKAAATEVRTIAMAHGQKKSRLVAWTFFTAAQQEAWQAQQLTNISR
jgi:23S rRNA (adenine1618-N6)-methyltransferase